MTRHNGRAGAHGTYNPKHNDRSFNLANSEHIDPERAKGNIYWDCFHGFRSALAPPDPDDLAATFSEVERQFYETHYAFLEDYTGDRVCSKQLYAEALGNTNIPAEWETRAICEIMNTGISRGDIQGWQAHKTAKRYPKYGVQKGWERITSPETGAEDFSEMMDAEAQQLGFPF